MAQKQHFSFRIEGMPCDGCARHVTQALRGVPGVVEAQVPGWRSGKATVVAEDRVNEATLLDAVREAGYNAMLLERRELEGERRAPPHPTRIMT